MPTPRRPHRPISQPPAHPPQDHRTPLPPTRKLAGPVEIKHTPRVAFLHWGHVGSLEKGYCLDLYRFFVELANTGVLQLTCLGEAQGKNAPPFPDLNLVKAGNFDAFVSNGIWNAEYLYDLHRMGKPIVSLDHLTQGMPIDSVTFASRQPGEEIGRMIVSYGHKDVLFISRFRRDLGAVAGADPIIEDPTCAERRTAVHAGLLGTDVDFWPALPWLSAPGVKMTEMLAQGIARMVQEMGRWPSIIVVPSVELGEVALAEMKRHGLRVPEDISCISFFAPPGTDEPPPPMSTMEFSWAALAREGWKLLKARMDGAVTPDAPARHLEIPARYVDRGTVRNLAPR
ncbi:MAG: LacI family DNA-binding transcriptional regulator [Planctomycetota bacterium]|nr:LacI family DNA-binding transcriptional regulator [Planctomycetota bacterium]